MRRVPSALKKALSMPAPGLDGSAITGDPSTRDIDAVLTTPIRSVPSVSKWGRVTARKAPSGVIASPSGPVFDPPHTSKLPNDDSEPPAPTVNLAIPPPTVPAYAAVPVGSI